MTVLLETPGLDGDLTMLPRLPMHVSFHSAHATEQRSTGGVALLVKESRRWTTFCGDPPWQDLGDYLAIA